MPRPKRYNLHEVLSMLEDDPQFDEANIYLEPPAVGEDTDEDSGEEDGGGEPSNLNRNQLSAPASVTIRSHGVRLVPFDQEDPVVDHELSDAEFENEDYSIDSGHPQPSTSSGSTDEANEKRHTSASPPTQKGQETKRTAEPVVDHELSDAEFENDDYSIDSEQPRPSTSSAPTEEARGKRNTRASQAQKGGTTKVTSKSIYSKQPSPPTSTGIGEQAQGKRSTRAQKGPATKRTAHSLNSEDPSPSTASVPMQQTQGRSIRDTSQARRAEKSPDYSIDSEQPSTSTSLDSERRGKRANPRSEKRPATKKAKPAEREWRKRDIADNHRERFPWNARALDSSRLSNDPVKLFELFFDYEVIDMMVEYSILYARFKGNNTFEITGNEMRAFLGVLLVSGYSCAPRRNLYWSHDTDVHNEAISAAMSRNRFDEIMRYLHLADNTNLDKDDKFTKVRLLISLLNEKFQLYFDFLKTQNLSIDESMIPYFGRHGAKQFIRGKPIRFGFKVWVLATPLGYVVQFDPYQGAQGRQTEYPGLGMGGSVVLDLVSELQEETGSSFHLTFDNLFTSLPLIDCLTEKKIGCTGTLRSNRTGDCPMKPVNVIKNYPRGSFDHATDMKNGITVVRWNDNNVVNAASNMVGVHPVQPARRWSRAESRQVHIGQPHMIRHYNRTMGGIDRMDQNVEKYRTTIRSKKWWWSLFAYCLDLSVQQTWHLHRLSQDGLNRTNDLLTIRRTIARALLARGPAMNGPGRRGLFSSLDKRVPNQVRFDRLDHLVEPWKTQLKCACCGMKTKHRCRKCQVGVHDRCFVLYHTK